MFPQVVFVDVKEKFVGPGWFVNDVLTVNVQPKLLVNVIKGELVPKPVTVLPETEPTLLVIKVVVCAGNAGDVFVIKTTPLFSPHVGLVNVKVAEGLGLATTFVVAVSVQPLESVTLTEYVPEVNPVAVEPEPPDGDQEYV